MTTVLQIVKNLFLFVLSITLILAYSDLSVKDGKVVLYYANNDLVVATSILSFFYIPSIFMIVFNILVSSVVHILKGVPLKILPLPNKSFWIGDHENSLEARKILEGWLIALALWVNILLEIVVVKVWQVNRDLRGTPESYLLYTILAILLLIGWLLYPFVRFSYKTK
jgi:hypothetical protein